MIAKSIRVYLILIFLFVLIETIFTIPIAFAQNTKDTLTKKVPRILGLAITPHQWVWGKDSLWPRPRIATISSLILPGAGQLYNKSYWKIPIVYAGLGTCLYFVIDNHKKYKDFQSAYQIRTDNDSTTIDKYADRYDNDNALRVNRDFYKRNRDFAIILGVIGYSLTAIEAYVDAHLKYFDVSNNLSMQILPPIPTLNAMGGIGFHSGISFKLKK